MSGVELIVGVVLGSIPIAIEVYNRSSRVVEVFSTFKQYPREVSILDAKLGVQRTIFRNNAINLLTTITKDQEYVLEVINRPVSTTENSDLVMASVYRNRIDALEESFQSCALTTNQIRNSLMVLYSQSDDFRAEVGERQQDVSTSEWMKHVKTRFRLALSKPKMEEAISDLRELNRDFGLITDQITKHLQQVSNEVSGNKPTARRPVKSLNVLQRYHRVRYASKALYSTLQVQWNCNTHQYHSFDVRIIDNDLGKGKAKAAVSRYVTCELAVTHEDSSSSPKAPLYLEIQQACDSDDEDLDQRVDDVTNIQQLTKVLERDAGRLQMPVSTSKKSRFRGFLGHFKRERHIVPTPIDTVSIPELPKLTNSLSSFHLSDQPSQPSSSSSTDLSLIDDICKMAYSNVAFRCSEARNQLLFNFGILMLEIGYGKPWHKLKQAVTATHEELTDYKIAEKLASQLVNQLGLAYPKIIRKCLGCDFGLGETDLDNEDLQRRFLEDVVAGLQQLKDYMAEMDIAPLG
ncbi:hypothetical protein CEP51_001696 [Fusarium floridanum]|uniref:DUF7580 domain-containing protein n=1 Tax=Fusarium floridanum TaxID=1325733 RepID=A0A428SFI1_9HYPO|nr:hypothetical protein CEP51_001696 [Fusarium floridanum]